MQGTVTIHKELETDQDRADFERAASMVKMAKALRRRVLARIRARAYRIRKQK